MICKLCTRDRRHVAHGYCASCYDRSRKEYTPEQNAEYIRKVNDTSHVQKMNLGEAISARAIAQRKHRLNSKKPDFITRGARQAPVVVIPTNPKNNSSWSNTLRMGKQLTQAQRNRANGVECLEPVRPIL